MLAKSHGAAVDKLFDEDFWIQDDGDDEDAWDPRNKPDQCFSGKFVNNFKVDSSKF